MHANTKSTHTHLTALCLGLPRWDFAEARDSEWQWHQLDHMQVCTSLQRDNHAITPSIKFFTGRVPFLPPNQQCQSTEGKHKHGAEMYIFMVRYSILYVPVLKNCLLVS